VRLALLATLELLAI
jgi:hypothetical protein